MYNVYKYVEGERVILHYGSMNLAGAMARMREYILREYPTLRFYVEDGVAYNGLGLPLAEVVAAHELNIGSQIDERRFKRSYMVITYYNETWKVQHTVSEPITARKLLLDELHRVWTDNDFYLVEYHAGTLEALLKHNAETIGMVACT